MPGDSILFVDPYDSPDGVRRAAEIGRAMRARGQQFGGIRLDSGDLAQLPCHGPRR